MDIIIQTVTRWLYDIDIVLPCWDIIANFGGICR
jgi:hypothetical protein